MKSKFKIIRNDFPIYTENEKGYLRSNIIAYALVGIFLLSLLIFKFSFAINIAFIMLGTFIFELLKGRQHNWISKEEELSLIHI